MRTIVYGGAVGGMLGLGAGWLPTVCIAAVMTSASGTDFWTFFLVLWSSAVLLCVAAGAGLGHAVARFGDD